MGTSRTESCEGCLWTQFKHLPSQPALRFSLVRLGIIFSPEQMLLLNISTGCPKKSTQV